MSKNGKNITIKEVIIAQKEEYKLAEISDIVKLIYQNEFAGGHMISDPADSLAKLKAEISGLNSTKNYKSFEYIGNNLCRANLSSILASGISPETLNNIFVYTANNKKGNFNSFKEKLEVFKNLCCNTSFIFPCELVKEYLANYEKIGFPIISHSIKYNNAYKPAYRVVDEKFCKFFDLFLRIERLLSGDKSPLIICIDGRSGSGKSTLGNFLANIYDCNLFHTDDFFLQPKQRTKKRLKLPGGNLDYERIMPEIFDGITSGTNFSYRRYNCSSKSLESPVNVTHKRLNIIEGVYSTHPKFDKYCDFKVFLTISPQTQNERIIARNGKQMHKRFKNEWIPMEETYFQTFGIARESDLTYNES